VAAALAGTFASLHLADNHASTPPLSFFYRPDALQGTSKSKKGKVFPYSLPSIGPRADPGVQAVSPQVT